MCNSTSVSSMTLQSAILSQIQEFLGNGQTFSVFDVTTALRSKCNGGSLEIPEVESSNPSATFRFDIRHDSVKAAFAELWDNALQSGLPALNRAFNGRYFVYEADQLVTPSVQSPIQVSTSNPVSATTVSATVVSGPTPVQPAPQLNEAEVTRRIRIYLENCTKTGHVPTPKQVQSAIKRDRSTGFSYDKIIDISKNLGYTLDVNV